MKKFALVAIAAAVSMVGCANVMPKKTPKPAPVASHKYDNHKHDKKSAQKAHAGSHEEAVYDYRCEGNGFIRASYNPVTEIAVLHITAPKLNLHNQEVQLKQAVSDSGVHFVNDTNPASIYEWHAKGSQGILSVTAGDKEYTVRCL